MTLREILQPAIELCEKGYPVHEWSSGLVSRSFGVLKENKYSHGNDLLLNGMPPKHGQVLKNKHLAEVLKVFFFIEFVFQLIALHCITKLICFVIYPLPVI